VSGFSKFAYGMVPAVRTFKNVAASTTDSVLLAGVPNKKHRVLAFAFVCGDTGTDATFNSKGSGAGVAISPLFANAANGGAVLGPNELGWLETAAGEALTLTTGSGSSTGVLLTTVEV
jgi:hypothetical protein